MSVRSMVHKFSGYEAAQSGAAFFIQPDPGYISISGGGRLDFLQRQTTNDLKLLIPGKVVHTVLTSPTARILDVFHVFEDEDNRLGVVTMPGFGPKTTVYLKKRIFFNDDVAIADRSQEFAQLDIEGPAAQDVLLGMGLEPPSETGTLIEGEIDGLGLRLISKDGFSKIGYRILIQADSLDHLEAVLGTVGMVRISEKDYEILRVETGTPAQGHELREDFTPLEVSLRAAISDQKGCYTGQEIIARQVNYDKITKQMVGLHLEEFVQIGVSVYGDSKPVGEITSLAQSPRFGTIGLAVIKRPYDQAGTEIEIRDGSTRINGRVSELPFVDPG